MRLQLVSIILSLLLAGCAAGPKTVLVRTDGQRITDNLALRQQVAIDSDICRGEANKANLSAGGNYFGGLAASIAENMRRNDASAAVAKGCMAARGYVAVPETIAAETSDHFAATRKDRQLAAAGAIIPAPTGAAVPPQSTPGPRRAKPSSTIAKTQEPPPAEKPAAEARRD